MTDAKRAGLLPGLGAEQHEALCTRCGTSCHFSVDVDGEDVVVTDLHCRFLARDSGGFGCTVYAERFERAPWCADVPEALEDGLLGRTCPYVAAAGVRGYRGKRRLTPRQEAALLPAIREALLQDGAPLGADPDGIRRVLARTGGGRFRLVEDPEAQAIWILPER